uniref:Ig-like domain-containing protein n=1 Tax=Nothobranchius furzeri TaxID=105023 RepID=A0A8C6KKN3_NOTFU
MTWDHSAVTCLILSVLSPASAPVSPSAVSLDLDIMSTIPHTDLMQLLTSFLLMFLVADGPENTLLTISPSKHEHVKGSDVQMFCSAVSSPDASFQWFVNGNPLPDTGPELRLMNVQTNQSGNYSCQTFNSKTLRYQTSQPLALSVIGELTFKWKQELLQ